MTIIILFGFNATKYIFCLILLPIKSLFFKSTKRHFNGYTAVFICGITIKNMYKSFYLYTTLSVMHLFLKIGVQSSSPGPVNINTQILTHISYCFVNKHIRLKTHKYGSDTSL